MVNNSRRGDTKQGTSLTALKALRALEVVAEAREPLSAQDAADRLGTDKVSAYRMLVTLETAGYVVRDEHSRRYSLSYKVISLSRNLLAENEVTKLVTQTLHELSVTTKETLHYSVLDGNAAVLVHRVKGSQLVNVDFQIGDRASLHCTSIGKVLLAYQDTRYVDEVVAHGLPRFAENTVSDPDQLRVELQRIRAQGYALDDHEFSDTMRCIAVPIFSSGGRVQSGISISGPDSRFTIEKLHELKEPMLEASRKLSQHLGGIPWSA